MDRAKLPTALCDLLLELCSGCDSRLEECEGCPIIEAVIEAFEIGKEYRNEKDIDD